MSMQRLTRQMNAAVPPARRRAVLFLCTANSARSQMAEGLLRHLAHGRFTVQSAGLKPRPIHPMAIKVMEEIGIDIGDHRSKGIDELDDVDSILFVIILCADAEQGCPASFAHAAVRLSWPFDDPSREDADDRQQLAAFRRVREQIQQRIKIWMREELPASWSA